MINEYYEKQSLFFVEMIENLFWLGISNIYVGFNSENSHEYLDLIIISMNNHKNPLPDFEKIRHCLITDQEGWGNKDNLRNYVNYEYARHLFYPFDNYSSLLKFHYLNSDN